MTIEKSTKSGPDPGVQPSTGSQPRRLAGDALQPVRDTTHQLITEIARALVDNPAEVSVEAIQHEENTILRLHVSPSDIGKVIGKQGRTAHSMRTILSAVSMKYHHRYTLDIVERSEDGNGEVSKDGQGGS